MEDPAALPTLLSDLRLLGEPSDEWRRVYCAPGQGDEGDEGDEGASLDAAVRRAWAHGEDPHAMLFLAALLVARPRLAPALCACVRWLFPALPEGEPRPARVLELVEAWARGEVGPSELRAAEGASESAGFELLGASRPPSNEARYAAAVAFAAAHVVEVVLAPPGLAPKGAGGSASPFVERRIEPALQRLLFAVSDARAGETPVPGTRARGASEAALGRAARSALCEAIRSALEAPRLAPVATHLRTHSLKSEDGVAEVRRVTRWLRPARPRLAAARAIAGDALDPRDAWERLAIGGSIPPAWVDHPGRAFAAEGAVPPGALPPTVSACVSLAADPQGVVTAEALAHEFSARLARRGGPRPARLVWRVEPRAVLCTRMDRAGFALLRGCTAGGTTPRHPASEARLAGVNAALGLARPWLGDATAVFSLLRYLQDRSNAGATPALVDPYEPLFALFDTGYALLRITESELELGAPCA